MNIKRVHQISEEIRRAISEIVLYKLKDPRIPEVISISHVNVTNDLSYAKVYVSIFGDKEKSIEALEALEKGKGFIKKELGKIVKLRIMPELIFINDDSIELSLKMNKLIEEVNNDNN